MTDAWTGSSWDRVCRAVFGGDEARMLQWARRYLAAYPDVNAAQFHLGAEFRSIVGPRARLDWWRKAVAHLERRGGIETTRRDDGQVSDAEATPYAVTVRAGAPLRSRESRLRSFDEATERQRRRELGRPPFPRTGPPPERGWTRDDANERRT